MPSPGDPGNLAFNLATLAQLANKPPGSKLSYSPSTARFSVDEPGKLQGVIRTIWRDSITNDEYFGTPIRELFAAAHVNKVADHVNKVAGQVNKNDIDNAISGLKTLRTSYANDQAKLAKLNATIEDAKLGMKEDPAVNQQLRKDYPQYLLYGFAQAMFLPESNSGVCYSFTVHWARRILMGKANFGIRKNQPAVHPLTLDKAEKKRMMKKVDSTIRDMQSDLKQWRPNQFGTAVKQVATDNQKLAKYSSLNIYSCSNDPQLIDDTASGSEVIKAVRRKAKAENNADNNVEIFLVNFAPKNGRSGHTIGIHLDGGLHFFDSNFGEFRFPPGCADRDRFMNDWWRFYSWGSWKMEGVY
ncbi:YopT-type cysteine protease domain-containing protein [Mesorhizobium sp. LHD-90]|uniref:YopT-type cysteine protease domain-containing protein n=1 Tax=Mesorhizobium sp. LHD-90 TaxID=3071414 RepID=UPI0027DF363D|nr:YopT-type cysteine protease domain-containing protein [Mesorhizobium sp. LHD-90]MDQ6433530.1 YopT-type cysteine protease domain-containing protein [Mesorhizobium sp. LHD-90]